MTPTPQEQIETLEHELAEAHEDGTWEVAEHEANMARLLDELKAEKKRVSERDARIAELEKALRGVLEEFSSPDSVYFASEMAALDRCRAAIFGAPRPASASGENGGQP